MRARLFSAGALLGVLLAVTGCTDPVSQPLSFDAPASLGLVPVPEGTPAVAGTSTTGVRMIDLGLPDATAWGISSSGVIVGQYRRTDGGVGAFRWHGPSGAVAEDLGTLDPDGTSTRPTIAYAVNAAGDVVGTSANGAFALPGGAGDPFRIGVVDVNATFSEARGVGREGAAVGMARSTSFSGSRGWLGRVGQESAVLLPGGSCNALDVDDSAAPLLVTGLCFTEGGARAVSWTITEGTLPEPTLLASLLSTGYSVGWFGGYRWIAGYWSEGAQQAGPGSHAALFDPLETRPVGDGGFHIPLGRLPGGTFSIAQGLADGHVAGYGNGDGVGTQAIHWYVSGWELGQNPAFIVVDRRALGTWPGHTSSRAYGVSDSGVVVGFSVAPGGERRAVAWFLDGEDAPNTAPVVSILSPADGSEVPGGEPVTFQALATDAEDGVLGGEAVTWASSLDGPLGDGTVLTVPLLSPGTHQVTVTATDSQGAATSASISVAVRASLLEELLELRRRVHVLSAEGRVGPGGAQALGAQLDMAIRRVRAGDPESIRGVIGALVLELDAMVRTGRISSADAEWLRPGLLRVQQALGV